MARLRIVAIAVVAFGWMIGVRAAEAARVELEVYTVGHLSLTAQQEWLRELARAGVEGLRIREGQAGDQPGIETRGSASSPTYVVTGALSGGELVLPGARFRLGETARVARWLEDVARTGPSMFEKKTAFGLTAAQFAQVQKELAQPVGALTKGRSGREVVESIASRLASPLRIDGSQLRALEGEKVETELGGLSCGSVLAYVLRPVGLALVPDSAGGSGVAFRVVDSQPGLKIWPVGWAPEKRLQQVLPTMFEFFNANVEGVPLGQVLEVIGQRLKTPVLLDYNALARYDIHPEKVTVSAPPGRTSYNLLLRKVLGPAQLTYEVRVDEAGKPFLWITSVRPM